MPDKSSPSTQCGDLVAALPDTVLDSERRDIEPPDAPAAAWGDPAIVLRCGVPKPAALRPDSQCFVVNDIGWLASQAGVALDLTSPPQGDVTFTTIGRSVYVEIAVPGTFAPHQGDALVDVAAAVADTTQVLQPCQ